MMQQPWKTWRGTSSGRHSPRPDAVPQSGGEVVYTAKDGKSSKVFDAIEWLATMCTHVPNRGKQMVRY